MRLVDMPRILLKNEADPMGHGDQGMLKNQKNAQCHRNVWSAGGDVNQKVKFQNSRNLYLVVLLVILGLAPGY